MHSFRFKFHSGGFTLIEIMVVVAIVGILASLVVVNIGGNLEEARLTEAKSDLRALDGAIETYNLRNGQYPTMEDGLSVLYPDYVRTLKQDPWGNDYVYVFPGDAGRFDVFSLGADGVEGGSGVNADIYAYGGE